MEVEPAGRHRMPARKGDTMKSREFKSICSAVDQGEEKIIAHRITHQHGRVMGCDRTGFEVATADGDRELLQHWAHYNCERDAG
jgi:hypothetical protein